MKQNALGVGFQKPMTTSMVSPSAQRSGGKYSHSKINFKGKNTGFTSKVSSIDAVSMDNHIILGL